jgi:hypothetical protein
MNAPAIVALVVAALAIGIVALLFARRPRWSRDSDRAATYGLKDALPLRNVKYIARVTVQDALDLGRLAAMRAFRDSDETRRFTHPELARRHAELEAAVDRFLTFVEERADADGDLRRFPVSWETERPDEWRSLVTRWIDVSDDVTICHEEFFRAARRLLDLRRPDDKSDVLA